MYGLFVYASILHPYKFCLRSEIWARMSASSRGGLWLALPSSLELVVKITARRRGVPTLFTLHLIVGEPSIPYHTVQCFFFFAPACVILQESGLARKGQTSISRWLYRGSIFTCTVVLGGIVWYFIGHRLLRHWGHTSPHYVGGTAMSLYLVIPLFWWKK